VINIKKCIFEFKDKLVINKENLIEIKRRTEVMKLQHFPNFSAIFLKSFKFNRVVLKKLNLTVIGYKQTEYMN